MKIYLASFLENENFGDGRLIGIVNQKNKPRHLECDFMFPMLAPSFAIANEYVVNSAKDKDTAGEKFQESFQKQLDEFRDDVIETAKAEEKTVQELLPFTDGDTLASWEREERTHYREQVAACLKELGYDVVSR